MPVNAKKGNHRYNVFGMTWSFIGDWTQDLPHVRQTIKLNKQIWIVYGLYSYNREMHLIIEWRPVCVHAIWTRQIHEARKPIHRC